MEDFKKSISFDNVKMELADVNTVQESQDLEEMNNVTIKVEDDWSEMYNGRQFQWTKPESKNFVSDKLTTNTGDGISRWTVMSTTLTPLVESEESLQTVRIGLESEHPKDKPAISASNGGGLVDVITGNHSDPYWSPKHEITSDKDGSLVDVSPSVTLDPPVKSLDCGTSREEMSESNSVTQLKELYNDDKANLCDKEYSHARTLPQPNRTHTGEVTLTCNKSGKGFSTCNDPTAHNHTHTDEELFRCGVCHKKFPGLGVLRIHENLYQHIYQTSEQKDKLGSDKTNFAKHATHVENVGHIQLTCTKPDRKQFDSDKEIDDFPKFSSKSDAVKYQPESVSPNGGGLVEVFTGNHSGTYWSPKHEITSDKDGSPVDNCPPSSLDPPVMSLDCVTPREEMSEFNSVTHLCDVCGKQYSSASALSKHSHSMHSTTHTCHICGKAIFSTYTDLTGHCRTHTGEEASIKCGVCCKKFPHLEVLSIHQKIYHNIHLASIQNGKLCSDQASLAKQKHVDNVGPIQLTSNIPVWKGFDSNKDIDDFPKISSKSAAEQDQPKCVALDIHVPFREVAGKFQCSDHQPESQTFNGNVLRNNKDDGIMRWTVTQSDILPLVKPEETSKTVAISNDSSTSPIQNPKIALNKDGTIMNLSPCEASEPHIKAIVCVSNVTQQNVLNPDATHYKCTICGKGLSGADLSGHQCEQTGEKSQRLGVCDKGFPESSNININPHPRTAEQPDACNICGKRVSISNTVRRYQVQNADENGYNCDLCDKCFTPSCYVAPQQCTENVEKLFNCSICNKEFTEQEALRQHCLTHKEKPYKCATCGRGFSHQMYFDRHNCTRTKYHKKCPDCGKIFVNGYSLRRHRRIHTGEKRYECDFCHKKFTDKSNLTEHRRTHTGEKPYKCDICQQEYARSQSLRKHLCIRGGD